MHPGKRNKPRAPKIQKKTLGYRILAERLMLAGFILIGLSAFLIGTTLWPIMKEEIKYTVRQTSGQQSPDTPLVPKNTEFGLVIPKIGANSTIVPNVDPYDSAVYQKALMKGVAHAKGSAFPGDGRNTFLFAHSSVNFFEASRYNAVFYLLSKMDKNDTIYVFYKHMRFSYAVTDIRIVPSSAVEYLFTVPKTETVTLMTCWPPGMSNQRRIVIAERLP